MEIETAIIHAGRQIDLVTGSVNTPIYPSTTFARAEDGSYPQEFIYSRIDNPNRRDLERCLAALEGGAAALAFASGSAATMSIFQALSPGDHIIAPQDAYHGTTQLLKEVFIPWGLQVSFVDMTNLERVARSRQSHTKLIWVETPSNPMLRLTDIAAVADLAHQVQAICVCDSTWAPPVVQRPFDHGADWVVHATTKYLGGHSDLLGGVAITKTLNPIYQRVQQLQRLGGAVPSAFDCWLLLRGIRTLSCRLQRQTQTALKLAEFLNQHPQIAAVHYPGLPSHPQYELACRQMYSFGGMLSVQVQGGEAEAIKVAA
jgi:cystathionine gamma-synthase